MTISDEDAKKIGDAVLEARVPPSLVGAVLVVMVILGIGAICFVLYVFLVILVALLS